MGRELGRICSHRKGAAYQKLWTLVEKLSCQTLAQQEEAGRTDPRLCLLTLCALTGASHWPNATGNQKARQSE